MTSSALGLLGIARKAGKLALGEEPVGTACQTRRAKAVLLAADAAENTVRRAQQTARTANVPCVRTAFTKAELGWQLGRASCAVVAVTDEGLSAGILSKLAGPVEDPEQ